MPYKDPALTQPTFPIIDGIRWGLWGEYATVNDDGTINLVGRGSRVINTGGENSSVVALVAVSEGAAVDHDAWTRHCRSPLASYKAPRHYLVVDGIPRAANGKTDPRAAEELIVRQWER